MRNPTPADGFAPATINRILGLVNALAVPACLPAVLTLGVLALLAVGVGWWLALPATLPGDEIYTCERVVGLSARTLSGMQQLPDAPAESYLTGSGVWLGSLSALVLIVGCMVKAAHRAVSAWLTCSARDLRLLVADDRAAMGLAEISSSSTPVRLFPHGVPGGSAAHLRLPLDDAFWERTLPRCADRVRELIAVDHDCSVNINFARRLVALRRDTDAPPLESLRLRVDSRAQRLSIGHSEPGEFADLARDVRLTSLPAARCRRLLREQPPNKVRAHAVPGRPALVIVGLGDLGVELLNQLCAQAQSPALNPLRIVIVDTAAQNLARDLHEACPALAAAVEIRPLPLEADMPQFAQVLIARLNAEGITPVLIYLALKDGALAEAWERELALVERASGAASALVLAAIRPDGRHTGRSLLAEEEELDALPRRQHAAYVRKTSQVAPANGAAQIDWAHLPFEYQEDNRSATDHLWTVARELDLAIVATASGLLSLPEVTAVEPLAMAEHRRWFASRALAGWRYGTIRAESHRTHPLMAQWSDLSEGEREKDRSTIHGLPETLGSAEHGLRRLATIALPLHRMEPQPARAAIEAARQQLHGQDPAALAHFLIAIESVEHFQLAQELAARRDIVVSLVVPQSLTALAVASGQEPQAANALMQASWRIWLTTAAAVDSLFAGDLPVAEGECATH